MRPSMFDEKINLIKSLNGRYKEADKEMVLKTVCSYRNKYHCSYKEAYDMCVEGNPAYTTFCAWRRLKDNA